MGALSRAFVVYSGLRLVLFALSLLVLAGLGVQGLVAIALALLVSSIASLVVLRRQRDRLSAELLARGERRGQEKARLRGLLDEGGPGATRDET